MDILSGIGYTTVGAISQEATWDEISTLGYYIKTLTLRPFIELKASGRCFETGLKYTQVDIFEVDILDWYNRL